MVAAEKVDRVASQGLGKRVLGCVAESLWSGNRRRERISCNRGVWYRFRLSVREANSLIALIRSVAFGDLCRGVGLNATARRSRCQPVRFLNANARRDRPRFVGHFGSRGAGEQPEGARCRPAARAARGRHRGQRRGSLDASLLVVGSISPLGPVCRLDQRRGSRQRSRHIASGFGRAPDPDTATETH